jgi:hypothetical protein
MPFALHGKSGSSVVEARNERHMITFRVDELRREPVIDHQRIPLIPNKKSTSVCISWPESACSILTDAKSRFLQIADDFGWLNPHLRIRVEWDGEVRVDREPSAQTWKKWHACDPTSAHWYDLARLERYIAAHVSRDQDHGRARTVREFIGEVRGFSGSAKQKRVLDETGLTRAPLSSLFGSAGDAKSVDIERLRRALQAHSKPVKPHDLGLIGKDHLLARFKEAAVEPETFKYQKTLGETEGLPWVVETAFGWCPSQDRRRIITGVNWSVGLGNPSGPSTGTAAKAWKPCSPTSGPAATSRSFLSCIFRLPAGRIHRPRQICRHAPGRSRMTSPAQAITSAVRSVTKDWAKRRKAEDRNRNAALHRRARLVRSHRTSLREAAFDVMAEAYSYASDGGKLPVKPRQIIYAARPKILRRTGQERLNGQYFAQTQLIDYMEEHDCSDWDIIWDARGHFAEPHTGCEIPLGTLEVRQYLGERPSFDPPPRPELSFTPFPTAGPQNRYSNVLFIEKEGFHSILAAAHLQERFDIALMSTKGMSVTASRMLIDRLAGDGVTVFALHDFDRSGFSIFGTLGTDSRRYIFDRKVRMIDLGLRLADVREMALQSEPVPNEHPLQWRKRAATLRRHGATPDEIEVLRTRRVELNAMASRQLVDFIEGKLTADGVAKLIPDDATLEEQARRIFKHQLTQRALAKIADELAKQAETADLPENLREQIAQVFKIYPGMPWDHAVAQVLHKSLKRDPA